MYLTRMALDISKPDTMKAFLSPNLFHGAIEKAFPGDRARNLWRIDSLRGERYLLIVSEKVPDLSNAVRQFGKQGEEVETRDYSSFIRRLQDNSTWRFRLVANPSITTDVGNRHRVVSHVTVHYQKKWLMDRAEKNGFLLYDDDFDVIWKNRYSFYKSDRNHVQFTAVAYEGTLTIANKELFGKVLESGIGRERAYGMGMMTVAGVSRA